MNHHQSAATSDAAALITRAATGDHSAVWTLADEIAHSEHVRETLAVLAGNAAACLAAVADLRRVPLETILEQLAAFTAHLITEGGE